MKLKLISLKCTKLLTVPVVCASHSMFARPVPPLGQRQGFFCPEEAAWSLQGAGASLFCPCSCIVRCTLALWYVHLVQCTILHHTLLHTCQCTQSVCMQLVSCVWQCASGQGTWILLLPGKDMVLAWLGRFVGGWLYMEPGNELTLMVRRKPLLQNTAVSAARRNVKLLQWKLVFKSPFWIQKLWKAKIRTEYSYDLMFHPITFLFA